MEQDGLKKYYLFKVNNPDKSNKWETLWRIDSSQCGTYQELADELSKINAPLMYRVFPDND